MANRLARRAAPPPHDLRNASPVPSARAACGSPSPRRHPWGIHALASVRRPFTVTFSPSPFALLSSSLLHSTQYHHPPFLDGETSRRVHAIQPPASIRTRKPG